MLGVNSNFGAIAIPVVAPYYEDTMHPRTEVIHSGKVRVLDVTESLTYQGSPVIPGGGIQGFTGTENVTAPNNTVNASQILVDATSTNADAVLSPKGTGSLLANLPDNLASGGNKRGEYAVDLQMYRLSSAAVASGNYSVVAGGTTNTASGAQSIVVGGNQNNATNQYSAVLSGNTNNATGNAAGVLCGSGNTASGYRSSVIGGESATASGSMSIAGGSSQSASGIESVAIGGSSNSVQATKAGSYAGQVNTITSTGQNSVALGGVGSSISGLFSAALAGGNSSVSGTHSMTMGNWCTSSSAYSVATGHYAVANRTGMRAQATGRFANAGDCQYERVVLRRQTTAATPTELTLDGDTPGTTTRLSIASDSTYTFHAIVTARRTDADNESAGWEIKGCIDNNAGTTALVGTVSTTVIGDDSAGAWTVATTADNTNDCLVFTVTGQVGKTIYWGAVVSLMKITG